MFKHYFLLWIGATLLLSASVLGVELLEGYKISTTEYMGLMNIGPILIVMFGLTAFLLVPVTLVPVSLLIRRFVRLSALRIILYTLAGAALGRWIFHSFYDDRFVREYGLHASTSIIIFLSAGLAYALIDHYSALRHLPSRENRSAHAQ